MDKYIKKINFLDEGTRECEILLNDGSFELLCFSQPYREDCRHYIYAFMPKNIMIADNKSFDVKKTDEGYFAYSLQGEYVNKSNGEVRVGKFNIKLDKDEFPKDINEGEYVLFDCARLDFLDL